MALNNPINFFRTDEKNALLNKEKTVGNNITTTSVTFVDKPDTSSKDAIEANNSTGGGAIFIEGKKVIQGVSVPEKQYLWDQLGEIEKAKYSAASISVSPNSGTWGFDTSAQDITFIFESRYNNKPIICNTHTVNGTNVDNVPGVIGRYQTTITCASSDTGSQSITANFKFTYDDTGYGTATKYASASWTRHAYSVVINTIKGEKPTEEQIKNASVKLRGINSLTQYQTEANKDMWVCTPSYDTWKNMSSGGYPVPFDEAVTVVTVNNTVKYNCRRKSSIPEGALIEKIVITK